MLDPLPFLDQDLAIAAGLALLAGLVRGFTGFGSGMVMAPVFAVLFGPVEMVGVISLMELPVTAQLLPAALRGVDWRFIAPLAASAAIFLPVGTWVLASADPELLARVVAGVVVVFALFLATGWRYRGPRPLAATLGVGAISGLMMSTTSLANPPVLLYMLSGHDRAARHRANAIVYLGIMVVLLLAVFWFAGLLGPATLWRAVLIAPPFMAATWLGSHLFRRADESIYRPAALVILLAIGLYGLLR